MNIQLKKGCQTAIKACVSAEKKTVAFFKLHEYLRCILLAFLTVIISETLCRHSFIAAFEFLFDAPFAFFYNFLIILTTISLSLFCPKKGFATTVIIAGWLILSLVNCIVLSFRITPFSAIDFSIAINMLGIIDIYLNLFQLSLIIIGIAMFLTLLVFIWKRTPHPRSTFS